MAIEAPLWIYWAICALAMLGVIVNWPKVSSLLSPTLTSRNRSNHYGFFLFVGWLSTLIAAVAYSLLTYKTAPGNYQIGDLTVFSLLNGVLEQFMFIFWFLLGCWLGAKLGLRASWKLFALGFVSYALYSGIIHALFWFQVLPAHQPSWVMPPLLLGMSLAWMWLFWRYCALLSIVAMHVVIDFLTVGHLHFAWFEPYQL